MSDFADVAAMLRAASRDRTRNKDERPYRQRRAECDRDGHQYQVIGRRQPTAIRCPRCLVRWAVGARTEPEEAGR